GLLLEPGRDRGRSRLRPRRDLDRDRVALVLEGHVGTVARPCPSLRIGDRVATRPILEGEELLVVGDVAGGGRRGLGGAGGGGAGAAGPLRRGGCRRGGRAGRARRGGRRAGAASTRTAPRHDEHCGGHDRGQQGGDQVVGPQGPLHRVRIVA